MHHHSDLVRLRAVFGGTIAGMTLRCPSPGHSRHDNGTAITVDSSAPDGLLVTCHNEDDATALEIKNQALEILGRPWQPSHSFNGETSVERMSRKAQEIVLRKLPEGEARRIAERNGTLTKTCFEYQDEAGKPVRRAVREEWPDPDKLPKGREKNVKQQGYIGDEWKWTVDGCRNLPYRLPELIAATKSAHRTICITEGENKADKIASLGATATTNAGGAGKWQDEFNTYFRDCFVIIFEDNDDEGRKRTAGIGEGLQGIAAEVKVVRFPGKFKGYDILDHLDGLDDERRFWALMDAAVPWELEAEAVPDTPEAEPVDPHQFSATRYAWIDPATIARREWLYGRHLIRKFVSVTVAPGGIGKSSLLIGEALSLASGKPLLGQSVPDACRVWLWNLEDPRDELARRIQAACQLHGLHPGDLGDRLFVDSGREQSLCTATTTKNGARIVRPAIENLVAEIRKNHIDILIIDPFISSHQVTENDNPAMDMVAKEWGRVADQTNTAIELVHHTRKLSSDVEVTAESSRGGKALTDAARDVRAINRMSAEDGEKAGVDNHRLYFRAYSDKANLSPPAEKSDWYRLENVELANGDHVGVVTSWKWPDAFDGLSVSHLRRVQDAITGKRLRKDVQARDWAGYVIATVLDMDADNKSDRHRIQHCIKTWLDSGALKVTTIEDEKGKMRPVLEVGEWAI